jgi:hypothetical protein
MKQLHSAISEYKRLKKQGYPNVTLAYNFLSNRYWVSVFSHKLIESRFNRSHEVIITG